MNTKLLLVGAMALVGMAGSATAQISSSAHNFSTMSWSGGEICKPCHTPHFSNVDMPRLWNHTLTVATYQMHEGSGTAAEDFDVDSRLCLSCHDGTVALDSFGGQTGTNFAPTRVNLGTDLRNDHPVGSDAQYPPTPPPSYWATSMRAEAQLPSGLKLKDWTDTGGVTHRVVSCMTCHNPHNKGFPNLLTMSNSASAICLGCHIK